MLALLGFYTVVLATLTNRVIALSGAGVTPTGRYHDLQLYFTIPSFASAVLAGRVIGRLHQMHRVACALGCSAIVTIAACLNFYFFVPDALAQPLVPQVATQIAVGMIFIVGLFLGISSRPSCEPQPSS